MDTPAAFGLFEAPTGIEGIEADVDVDQDELSEVYMCGEFS